MERLLLRIQAFEFEIKYISGKVMLADVFSRLCAAEENVKISESELQLIAFVQEALEGEAISIEMFREKSIACPTIQQVKNSLETGNWSSELKIYKMCAEELMVVDDILMRGIRMVVPLSLRSNIVKIYHEGHPGATKMKSKLRQRFWYPYMDKDVEKLVAECVSCKLVALPDPPTPLQRTSLPNHPWEVLGIDLFGPVPSGEYVFVIVDYYSRFIETKILRKTETRNITQALDEIFARFGFPVSLRADNGPQFSSEEFKAFCREKGIKLIFSPPYFPRVNGEVERQMRALKKTLSIAYNTGKDWKQELLLYLFNYRTTPHCVTGVAPAELLLKRSLKDKLPNLPSMPEDDIEMRDKDFIAKQKGKEHSDTRHKAKKSSLSVGDWVLVKRMQKRNKLESNFNPPPCKVISLNEAEAIVESEKGNKYRRSVTHLKKIKEPELEQEKQVAEVESDVNSESDNEVKSIEDEEEFLGFEENCSSRAFTPQECSTPVAQRPSRQIRLPQRLLDYTK